MKRHRFGISGMLVAALCAIVAANAGAAVREPSPDEALKTLRKEHPRLIALDSDIARVRRLIESNDTARRYYERLKERGTDWLDAQPVEFKIVGPRLLSQSRRCLMRVMTWSLLYRLDGDKRFADRAKKEMFVAADFPHWNPSHFLDTAEMSHAFAIGYDWLYDYLKPDERTRIREALIEKGLKPALDFYENDRWWVRSHHNWNQVCNGGITIGALAIADEAPDMAGYIVAGAVKSIQRAMASYAPDGGWAEGPGYWHYATRYNVYFLAALESALGTDFGLSTMEGFDKAGHFRVYFSGPVGRTFNYADAGSRVGHAAEMFWLARKFDEPLYAWHERQCARRSADAWDLLWFDPRGQGPAASGWPRDAYFRGVEVAFFRSDWEDDDAIFVGFKGGDNKANHSHLDLGCFVLDALGERWAVDLGGDNYNLPGYFGNKRWSYFRLNTQSHNTLVIEDANQDPRAPAPMVAFSSKPDRAFAVTDLSKAYAKTTKRVRRGMALLDRRHVLVQDEVEAGEPVEVVWQMMTPAKVEVDGVRATLAIDDHRLALSVLEPQGARIEALSGNPPPEPPNQRHQDDVTKMVVRLPGKAQTSRIVVLMTPYEQGQEPPRWSDRIEPLDRWIDEAK